MPDNPSLNKKVLIVGALGILVGFLAGFFLANGLNRAEQEKLRAELAAAKQEGGAGKAQPASAPADGGSFPTLTDEQLGNAVKPADAAPGDVALQRKVGQALYAYAWEKGNRAILTDVAPTLNRAHDLD